MDLGSNSFRLIIARASPDAGSSRIESIDSLKRTVRLAAGLRADGLLDLAAQGRGIEALASFGERLRSFAPDTVRAVATNTLRVARNSEAFLATAEAALGFPIEIISGYEEARLVYIGASHSLPHDGRERLVIDIGGGSTECIIGVDREALMLNSAGVGCVALSQRFFPDGTIDPETFEQARSAACATFEPLAQAFRSRGWDCALGTSGTAKALVQIAQLEFGVSALDYPALTRIRDALLEAGHADCLQMAGLKPDRRQVLAGGLAVMMAAFKEFGIESMDYCDGALRHGVLHDLLERKAGVDRRAGTIERMVQRHGVDARHAARVRDTALALFDQGASASQEEVRMRRGQLGWAALLAECGMSVSQDAFHKHSAYILTWSDMPGFSRSEQNMLALLALAQSGGLRKLRGKVSDDLTWLMIVSLRTARLLHRSRDGSEVPPPTLSFERRALQIEMPLAWALQQPLAHASLVEEAALWAETPAFEQFDYRTT